MAKKYLLLTPLNEEKRSAVTTAEAAEHLNRKQQTLRKWASQETGPLKPIRINGRLGWLTNDLKRLYRGAK